MDAVSRILDGDIRAAARLMRDIDDDMPSSREALKELYREAGRAYIIGITGPPGAGKSTLTDQLIATFRKRGNKVGVVAIDPTSPFTGGAILGDRIRMNRHADDDGVFIRSLATRGAMGGLSRSTVDVALVMDAMGMDVVIIETVGVGQDEVDIVRTAHSTCVVMVPGLGDDIQAIKAGILEIGDLFVVNKADRDGADRTARELSTMLEFKPHEEGDWLPPVLKVEAQRGAGIEELVGQFLSHRDYLERSGTINSMLREREKRQLLELLHSGLYNRAIKWLEGSGELSRMLAEIEKRESNPYIAAESTVERMLSGMP